MPTCQYFGEANCIAPTFSGSSNSVVSSAHHENFVEHYFFLGTTPIDWLVNCAVWLLLIRFIVWPLVVSPLLDWIDSCRRSGTKTVTFELIPFHTISTGHASMLEFFNIIHSQLYSQSYHGYFSHRKEQITLEVVSRHDGIHYVAVVPAGGVESFSQAMVSLQPEIKIRKVSGYEVSLENTEELTIESFRQIRSFIYPLRSHTNLDIHDPVKYITSAMSNPNPKELFSLQFVISPFPKTHQVVVMRNKIMSGLSPFIFEVSNLTPRSILLLAYRLLINATVCIYNFVALIINLIGGNFSFPKKRGISRHEQVSMNEEIRSQIIRKLEDPLFCADIRILVVTHDKYETTKRTIGVASALATFDNQGYQSLVVTNALGRLVDILRSNIIRQKLNAYRVRQFTERRLSLFSFNTNILSTTEIADLYHFPYKNTVTTEGLNRSMSRMLSVPSHFKLDVRGKPDVLLGENTYHGHSTPIGLTALERKRHVYIVGGTGNGKTTMLEYAIEQDIRHGKGVALIDPHGDLAQKILAYVPEGRIKDVIYFNPSDLAFPIGINLLELPEGLTDDELLNEKDFVTESIVSIFRKIFSEDDSGGHRIEYILRNTIHTAMTIEDSTLFTVLKLLRNTAYRREVVARLDDQDLKDFWREELGKAGDFQRVKMTAGITSKIDRFRRSAAVQRVIGQPRSTINFDEILDGKILICNLAKGLIGEDTSELLGIAMLTKLQLAAYRRIRRTRTRRKSFFIYVDEFQNFATTQFLQMLSEARKYGVVLTMAEQSTSQQYEQKMVEIILNNVGTLVCFRTGSSGDERLLLPHFMPYIEVGDIGSLPAYNFYIRVRAEESYEPTSGVTVLLKPVKTGRAKKIQNSSRQKYASKINRVEAHTIDDNSQTGKTEVPIVETIKKNIYITH